MKIPPILEIKLNNSVLGSSLINVYLKLLNLINIYWYFFINGEINLKVITFCFIADFFF